jgi:hypothetical protein
MAATKVAAAIQTSRMGNHDSRRSEKRPIVAPDDGNWAANTNAH